MTPFRVILGDGGPTLLLAAIGVAAVLTLVAAALEIALERAGGPDPAAPPDWFAERGPALFVLGGVPALALACLGAAALTLALGGDPEESALPVAVSLLLDVCVVVAIVCCGLGSPLTRHWGLAITAFGAGVGAVFVLLFVVNALPFADSGSLAYPERFVFALAVGLILAALVVAAAALIALAVTSVRTYRAVRGVRQPAVGSRPTP